MPEQVFVSPWGTGSFAAIACTGVSCVRPPKGISTVPAPMVESNRSDSPFLLQVFRSLISAVSFSSSVPSGALQGSTLRAGTRTSICFSAPLEFRNLRLMSQMILPFQRMTRRGSAVTSATTVASRFSLLAAAMNFSASSFATTTAMRSWLSEMASSVPSSPSYFFGTAFKSMERPSASSPMATETPPAPKSLQRLIIRVASFVRNRRCSLRSTGALPFCTSAPQVSRLSSLWALEDPVAPPQPSRPVRPPSRITTSPGMGCSRRTFASGTAPTTAPISIRLAM